MSAEFLSGCGYPVSDVPRSISQVSAMRIKCPHCQQKATVYSRALQSDDVNAVYARCTNGDCEKFDHSFVSHVAFSHWIDPKAAAMQMTLTHLFDQLPAADRRAMAAELAARV